MAAKRLIVERDVEMLTRDGVVLRADVYRMDTSAQLPVLLQRTPYGKGFSATACATTAAGRGYAAAIPDARGRWASGRDSYPSVYKADDGRDTVEGAAGQPWSSGSVGTYFGSYDGYTKYAAASRQPPSLRATVPAITFCEPASNFHLGGAVPLGAADRGASRCHVAARNGARRNSCSTRSWLPWTK